MNLRKLAEITGYSVSTVSKAFLGGKDISHEARQTILGKAKELGIYGKYSKDKYDKKIIAVICPETASAYYTEILTILNGIIEKNNSVLIISVTEFSLTREEMLIGFFSENSRADGIIVLDGRSTTKKYNTTPIVHINSHSYNPYADSVNIDFYCGICEAVYSFKQNGHTKIAFIGEKLTEGKRVMFEKAMNYYNLIIDPEFIVVSDKRFEEAGFNAMESFFESGKVPTAIFTAYDYIALGVIHSMEKHGKSMPDDISIIGMDDLPLSSFHKISLSSIKTNTMELCKLATEILFKKINNRHYSIIQNISVKSELINRNSVKKI